MDSGTGSDAGVVRFDRYELRLHERALWTDGAPVKLGARAFDVLCVLVERRGAVVSKDELLQRVWPETVVEENTLQAQVVALRKALGAAAIVTVPGVGYRLQVSPEPPAEAVASPALRLPPHNLPHGRDALLGRDADLRALAGVLRDHRLVTITGPGGVGKSRLALQAAWHALPARGGGAWWVELTPLGDDAHVAGAVAAALGVAVHGDPLRELLRQLGDRDPLVVLDNAEHVAAGAAQLAETLLERIPRVRLLVTSQRALAVRGEQVLRLAPLACPLAARPTLMQALSSTAVQLLDARVRSADQAFALDEAAAPAAAAICRRLDGLPLAIEMAAARVPLLGLQGVADRLDERFRLLTAGHRGAPQRQRTLRDTLAWSHALLPVPEQVLLRRLAVFAGSFTLEAAAAVGAHEHGDAIDAIDRLDALCRQSLVVVETHGQATRYRLLETTRAYAAEQLAAAGEADAIADRHAAHLRRRMTRCLDDWTRLDDAAFHAAYTPELDNLRSAIARGLSGSAGDAGAEAAAALVGDAIRVWLARSLFAEAEQLAHRAAAVLSPRTSPRVRAAVLAACAAVPGARDHETVIAAAREAAALFDAAGDLPALVVALQTLAHAHAYRGDAEADAALAQAWLALQGLERPRLRAMLHQTAALAHMTRGDLGRADAEGRAALALWRAAGADGKALQTLDLIADLAWQQGDLARGIALAREALDGLDRLPLANRRWRLYAQGNLYGMLVEQGRDDEAAQSLWPALLREAFEFGLGHGWIDHHAAWRARRGDIDAALRLVGWADALRAARSLNRQPNERRARDAVLAAALRAGVDAAPLLAAGATLDEPAVRGIAEAAPRQTGG